MGGFCALPEPSVRFRINGLRFLFYLTQKRSLVRDRNVRLCAYHLRGCDYGVNVGSPETPMDIGETPFSTPRGEFLLVPFTPFKGV